MGTSDKLNSYPDHVRAKLSHLRQLILAVAAEKGIEDLDETLKWDQLSYLTKYGSTVRIAWSSSSPEEYGMYFHCQTKLVETFREIYKNEFSYQGNRAIIFKFEDAIAEDALKHCISLTLNYHKLKHLPLLGA